MKLKPINPKVVLRKIEPIKNVQPGLKDIGSMTVEEMRLELSDLIVDNVIAEGDLQYIYAGRNRGPRKRSWVYPGYKCDRIRELHDRIESQTKQTEEKK